MALLISDDIFKCSECHYPEFTVKEIESFTMHTNKDKSVSLLPNTKRKVITCNNCGKEYIIDKELKLERAE